MWVPKEAAEGFFLAFLGGLLAGAIGIALPVMILSQNESGHSEEHSVDREFRGSPESAAIHCQDQCTLGHRRYPSKLTWRYETEGVDRWVPDTCECVLQ